MTTAHRPTFDTARGHTNSSAPTRQYSSRSLPAHKVLKYRKSNPSRGIEEPLQRDTATHDMSKAAANQLAGALAPSPLESDLSSNAGKIIAPIEKSSSNEDTGFNEQDLQTTVTSADLHTESLSIAASDSSDLSDDEDEAAELMRELEQIKRERALEQDARAQATAADEMARRQSEIAFGNPLLSTTEGSQMAQRRWDEDVVFRVRESKSSGKPDFVNDLLRSDFHRSFMKKYVR